MKINSHMTSKTVEETHKMAQNLGKDVTDGGVICLYGDLGSGKTEFTKGLAEYFGIDKFSIKSPTYTYIRKYETPKLHFYHIDLYRLERIDDLLAMEIEEIMRVNKNIIVIEWADKMSEILPEKRIDVNFKYLNENEREIQIDKRSL